jgi:hypothetical protein
MQLDHNQASLTWSISRVMPPLLVLLLDFFHLIHALITGLTVYLQVSWPVARHVCVPRCSMHSLLNKSLAALNLRLIDRQV